MKTSRNEWSTTISCHIVHCLTSALLFKLERVCVMVVGETICSIFGSISGRSDSYLRRQRCRLRGPFEGRVVFYGIMANEPSAVRFMCGVLVALEG